MPFFFDLRQRDCLLIGGGNIATRKARLLAKAGAVLYVVSPLLPMNFKSWSKRVVESVPFVRIKRMI